jgi:hypothetical protein
MISFDKPTNLNGTELRQELNDAGVKISNEQFAVRLDDSNVLWLDIAAKDKSKAQAVVDAHNGTI